MEAVRRKATALAPRFHAMLVRPAPCFLLPVGLALGALDCRRARALLWSRAQAPPTRPQQHQHPTTCLP